ncbi:Nramp family divalent metal transporter [Chlorogloeopsis sp. ULAP01]|uniref:Nramp family divalent metal transporter n=1 Tax=Chlorogloeopsis sp. ULAP01 TaxID=3056483 RepID=UPI0025AB0518|nr:Nramp family divalent metal transporter [Chlorogloeopsis sp. ULAP01]MDM9379763.1 Nramp family divalent metal transporter [Chlorogloeopsis sp. ULAP01]
MTQLRERQQVQVRSHSPKPPKGWNRLKWYGPGLIWMISSVGSGSVLFTPRIGSRYEYGLLWMALIVIFFMWVMIREVGWYTVVTGKTILEGYRELPGPNNWAIWLIFLPQLVAAVVTVAGIAALTGSALMIAFPGNQALYGTITIIFSLVLVISGRYKVVELATSIMAGVLVAVAIITAARVFPPVEQFGGGLIPGFPQDLDLEFILPWVGFILAGAAGIMWFSYWVAAREYGGPLEEDNHDHEPGNNGHFHREYLDEDYQKRLNSRLKKWIQIMSTTAAIGVIGGGLVIVAFMILGAELLAPEGIIPEGIQVAEDLTRLLSEVWGVFGYWLLIIGVMIALAGTILSNQDGWGRMFADATQILMEPQLHQSQLQNGHNGNHLQQWVFSKLSNQEWLKNSYAIWITAILPLIVFFLVREPVDILSVGGVVTTVHTPVIVFLTLYLNRTQLPEQLQPGWFSLTFMVLSGLFFTGFAILYFLDLFGMEF